MLLQLLLYYVCMLQQKKRKKVVYTHSKSEYMLMADLGYCYISWQSKACQLKITSFQFYNISNFLHTNFLILNPLHFCSFLKKSIGLKGFLHATKPYSYISFTCITIILSSLSMWSFNHIHVLNLVDCISKIVISLQYSFVKNVNRL